MNKTTIYLDNNATTPVAVPVLAAMEACLRKTCGNPSSKHAVGEEAKDRLMLARSQVGNLIGAKPPEIVFTGSATEANHQVILGAVKLMAPRRRIVTSAVEHSSTLLLLQHLAEQGYDVVKIGVDGDGQLDMAALVAAVDPNTALVSVMTVNNETGVIYPIKDIAAIAKAAGALMHTDAVQAAGKLEINVQDLGVDMLTLSAHKLHGPKGVAALYVKKGLALPPLFFGHQERGRRGGTENVPAIVGFGVAAELALSVPADDMAAVAELRDEFEAELKMLLPQLVVHGQSAPRVATTISLRFGQLDAEPILHMLDQADICASSGAACASGGSEPSHVLLAMGLSREEAMATIRLSMSRFTSELEMAQVLGVLQEIVNNLTLTETCNA